jgi:hypothetical protein
MHTSVSITGIDIAPTNAMTYGIVASSAYITISSINVLDVGSRINFAAVSLSSWNTVNYTSITVGDAYGFYLQGSSMTNVSHSSAQINSGSFAAIQFAGGSSSNTFNVFLASNPHSNGQAVIINTGSNYNTLISGVINANSSLSSAFSFSSGSSSNTLSQSFISNGDGFAVRHNGSYNTISRSTMTSPSGLQTVYINGGSWSSIIQSYIYNSNGWGLRLSGSNNVITQSSMIAANVALNFTSGSSNTITQSYLYSLSAQALAMGAVTDNAVSLSTISSAGSFAALALGGADWNNFSGNVITASAASAVTLTGSADFNTFSQSTMTSIATAGTGLSITQSSTNTFTNSYIQGSTGVVVNSSTGTILRSNVIIATNTFGDAVWLGGGSVNLTITSSTLLGPGSSRGLTLNTGNDGQITISSNIVRGVSQGIFIATQTPNASFLISSVTFRSLASGATAINFSGGTVVSTISSVNFEDTTIGTNINASALDTASRLTMQQPSGLRSGPTYANDPYSLITWVSALPTNPTVSEVSLSSITVAYGLSGAVSYIVQASTASDFSGTLISSVTTSATVASLAPQGLSLNTTYYLRAGAISGSTTFYAAVTPAASVTLSTTPAPLTFSGIAPSQFTLQWQANGNPSGTVYEASVSTSINFTGPTNLITTTAQSAVFSSLIAGATYFARVRALNWVWGLTSFYLRLYYDDISVPSCPSKRNPRRRKYLTVLTKERNTRDFDN